MCSREPRPSRSGCNPHVSRAVSLNLGLLSHSTHSMLPDLMAHIKCLEATCRGYRDSIAKGEDWARIPREITEHCPANILVNRPLVGSLHLQQSDAHWDQVPEMPKSCEIKKGIFRFMGRGKPKLMNSENCVFEFLSSGCTWWFMGSV